MEVKIKICGIRDAATARLASALGADWLGFIFHPSSPRRLLQDDFNRMVPELPPTPRVFVQVRPSLDELQKAAGDFAAFQLHFSLDTPWEEVAAWSSLLGPTKLWLAPRLPPGAVFPREALSLAGTFLIDAYHPGLHGGTGQTGDWEGFTKLREDHPEKNWVLAGGLNPDNAAEAVRLTRARAIDVNSGVEMAPGLKDPDKMRRLFALFRRPNH